MWLKTSDMNRTDRVATSLSPRREYPYSLFFVVGLVLMGWLVVLYPLFSSTVVRVAVTIPLLLIAPGYAFLAALVPERKRSDEQNGFYGLDLIERTTYSVVLSLILVPLLGVLLNFTSSGISLIPVSAVIGTFTLVTSGIGIYRWQSLPPSERYSLGVRRYLGSIRRDLFGVQSRYDYVLNVVFIAALLIAGGGIGYGMIADAGSSGHSELFLATETENGTLQLSDYPTEFTRGEPRQLSVGLTNREGKQQSYALRLVLERVEHDRVSERSVIARYNTTLEDGEEWTKTTTVKPNMTGDRLRLKVEADMDESGPDVTNSPEYTNYLWITVSPSERNTTGNRSAD